MTQINKQQSFGSLIRVSKLGYLRATINRPDLKEKTVGFPWDIYQSKYLREGYSEDASVCTMGVIKNEAGDGFMFHLRPHSSPIETVYENIRRAAQNLKISDKNLTGLLVGGHSQIFPDFYKSIQSLFKELNIKYTAFLGQKCKDGSISYSHMYYNGAKDEYIIFPVGRNSEYKKQLKMSDLEKFYQTIVIRKGDKVKFD